MSHQVFISYARQDETFAVAMHDFLEREGIKCWLDQRDGEAGEIFTEEIIQSIREADIVVLLLSPSSNASKYVSREIHLAFESGKKIIPVRIEDVNYSASLSFAMSSTQWLDVFSDSLDVAFGKIKSSILHKLGLNESPVTDLKLGPTVKTTTIGYKEILIGLGSVLIFVAFIWSFFSVDRVLVELDLELSGLEFGLAQDGQLLFEDQLRLSSLGISGLEGIQFPAGIFSSQEAKNASAILIQSTELDSIASSGLVLMNLLPPAGARFRLLLEERSERVHLAMWDVPKYVPDASISGDLEIIVQRVGSQERQFEPGRLGFIPDLKDEVSFELGLSDFSVPVYLNELNVDYLSFFGSRELHSLSGVPSRSSIKSGVIGLGSSGHIRYAISEGQEVEFNVLQGTIRDLAIEDGRVRLMFVGTINELKLGDGASMSSVMPSRIELLFSRLRPWF